MYKIHLNIHRDFTEDEFLCKLNIDVNCDIIISLLVIVQYFSFRIYTKQTNIAIYMFDT